MRRIQEDILSQLTSLRPRPQAILDIGCGNGYFTRAIASTMPHARISAIDPNLSASLVSTGRINYVQSGVESIPFASNSFDVVVASMSFHHWTNKLDGIREAHRVLKPGGSFVVGDPFFAGIMRNRCMAWLLQATDGGVFTSFEDYEKYLEDVDFGSMNVRLVSNSFGCLFVVTVQKPDVIA